MATPIQELESRFRELDARLRPIAKQRVDPSDPNWMKKLGEQPHPLDAAGIRAEARDLLHGLTENYEGADDAWRGDVRALFRECESLAWAIGGAIDRESASAVRDELILFSMLDQGRDPRDAKLWLESLCRDGRNRETDFDSLLRGIALLSSREDRYGWGPTRRWLEQAAGKS